MTMVIQGFCESGFESVKQAFSDNFRLTQEEGGSVAVVHRGRLVVNLWAGTRDKTGETPWQEHTRANLFSASKGVSAVCLLHLVDRGLVSLSDTVATHWPEFAAADKSHITIADVLSHRSGVSAIESRLADHIIYDWTTMIAAIEQQAPWWSPGSAQGYSPFVYGWIVGELVRRISGMTSFAAYFEQAIAEPLGLQLRFGLPEAEHEQLATMGALKKDKSARAPESAALGALIKSDPKGVANRAFTNPLSLMTGTNSSEWRQAQVPAANGHGRATDLALLYGHLVNTGADQPLLSDNTLPYCWTPISEAEDRVLGTYLRFGAGFMLTQNRDDCHLGQGSRSFGHPGAGGTLGCADPDYQVGFGYVTHRMGQGLLVDERAKRLLDSVYACDAVSSMEVNR